jgi:hypothetical protein
LLGNNSSFYSSFPSHPFFPFFPALPHPDPISFLTYPRTRPVRKSFPVSMPRLAILFIIFSPPLIFGFSLSWSPLSTRRGAAGRGKRAQTTHHARVLFYRVLHHHIRVPPPLSLSLSLLSRVSSLLSRSPLIYPHAKYLLLQMILQRKVTEVERTELERVKETRRRRRCGDATPRGE